MNNLLPIFMKLEEKPCLVVGGGKIALQKIYQLIESKALITVVAPDISKPIHSQDITAINRCYKSSDLDGMKLVIAATNNKKINKNVFKDANKRGLPINVVDNPELCSFYMSSVYQDGDLKIAVSTNGKCPSFGKYIKKHINNISQGVWGKALDEIAIKREKYYLYVFLCICRKKDISHLLIQQFSSHHPGILSSYKTNIIPDYLPHL
jgi:siroheme synthase-like protein